MALNYQKGDKHCFRNHAKFTENGSCGYLLKPDFLTEPNTDYCPLTISNNVSWNSKLLIITIISGHHLPVAAHMGKKSPVASLRFVAGSMSNPYVRIHILGHPDERDTTRSTSVVQNNGFNPFWNETYQFSVRIPELAFLEIDVKDKVRKKSVTGIKQKIVRDPTIGSFVAPFNLICQGTHCSHNKL